MAAALVKAQCAAALCAHDRGSAALATVRHFSGLRPSQPQPVGLQVPACRPSQSKRGPMSMSAAGRGPALAPAIDPALQESLKRAVAQKAVEYVKSGMIVSLGTGSTSGLAIEELGKALKSGKLKDVFGVASSYQAKVLARQWGVKTLSLNDVNRIDLALDGADEVDVNKNLLKGGGAAQTMEKVVDMMAKRCVILVDQSKIVTELGSTFPVVVEVLQNAVAPVLRSLVAIGGEPEIRSSLRKDGPVITDLGNMVVDVRFPQGIKNPAALEKEINNIPGVVENGIFAGFVDTVLVSIKDGDNIVIVELQEAIDKYGLASQQ